MNLETTTIFRGLERLGSFGLRFRFFKLRLQLRPLSCNILLSVITI